MTTAPPRTPHRPVRRRALSLALGLAATLALAGCGGGGGAGSEPVFKAPSYAYLTPLRLNVGQIRIEDQAPPPDGPDQLAQDSPVTPDQALRQMARDRLVAAGNSGTAVFTIDQASITGQPGGTLDGTLAVHLDIIGNSGGHSGYAEAHVSHEYVPGTGDGSDAGGLKAQLYALTNTMMQDMNVEFEYQLRRTLGDWLLDASGAPLAASVQQQSLTPPGAPPPAAGPGLPPGIAPPGNPSPASVGAPVQLAPPPDVPPPAPQLSPPPGFLQPPPGVQPLPAPVPFPPGGGGN